MDRKRLVAGAAAVTVLALGGTGVAYAAGDDGGEQATGPAVEKAKSAALDHTSGGRVTGAEVGDEEGYYEIEVTRDDGTQVDVHLDRDLDTLGTSADDESPDDEDGPDDD
jgi:uncharacterized membrane protein YkoI